MQDDFTRPKQNTTASPAPDAADTPTPEAAQEPTSPPQVVTSDKPRRSKKWWFIAALILLLALAVAAYWRYGRPAETSPPATAASSARTKSVTKASQGLQLDSTKNYGNKYANGILPVGDGKYTTSSAKQGYVYACSQYAQNLQTDSGGAGKRGPWFSSDGTTYDITKKTQVNGSVMWQSSFSDTLRQGVRVIVSNDLPDHATGIFPIAATDPAYAYDKNPNTISAQNFSYGLPANPTYGSPNCIGGQVGVMLTGVAIFSGFDAGGRDAGAWEVQDSCSGHPEKTGTYHYHTLSSCIKDTSVHTVIGFALDGFPITGPQVAPGNILTTADLDECHGITSQITLDKQTVTQYHYVMTQDFPYSVACYRGKATQPPGQQAPATRQHP